MADALRPYEKAVGSRLCPVEKKSDINIVGRCRIRSRPEIFVFAHCLEIYERRLLHGSRCRVKYHGTIPVETKSRGLRSINNLTKKNSGAIGAWRCCERQHKGVAASSA